MTDARWQCEYVNSKGVRCSEEALHRIHYSLDHPFDHMDVCKEHLGFYRHYCVVEDLKEKKDAEKKIS